MPSWDVQRDSYPTIFEVKVHHVALATPGQQATVSRQVMVPLPCPNQPTTPWLLPEGGVSSSQVQGKQGRGGGGLWPS